MSLDISISTNGIRVPIAKERMADAARAVLRAERVANALVSVTLLTRPAIARMNRDHLSHSGPTDVISFGFARATPADPVVGDIYIAPDVARVNAHARGVSVREELTRLVVHGTLHILGYDHPEGEDREDSDMWRRQERHVRRLLERARR